MLSITTYRLRLWAQPLAASVTAAEGGGYPLCLFSSRITAKLSTPQTMWSVIWIGDLCSTFIATEVRD